MTFGRGFSPGADRRQTHPCQWALRVGDCAFSLLRVPDEADRDAAYGTKAGQHHEPDGWRFRRRAPREALARLWAAVAPKATTRRGFRTSISLNSHRLQTLISPAFGFLCKRSLPRGTNLTQPSGTTSWAQTRSSCAILPDNYVHPTLLVTKPMPLNSHFWRQVPRAALDVICWRRAGPRTRQRPQHEFCTAPQKRLAFRSEASIGVDVGGA